MHKALRYFTQAIPLSSQRICYFIGEKLRFREDIKLEIPSLFYFQIHKHNCHVLCDGWLRD